MNITQEQRNKIKTQIQNIVSDLSLKHKFLCIEVVTGAGKAKMLIESIHKSTSTKKWLICVPEIAQIENLKKEFIKFGYENLLSTKVEEIICYASLKNYENTTFNLGLNEVQNLSPSRLEVCKTIIFDQIIADSATISYEIKERLAELGDFHTYSLDLKEGTKLGIVPKPVIHIVKIDIEKVKTRYEWTAFKKPVKGSALEYYGHIGKQMKYWRDRYNREGDMYMLNKSLQYASMRKRLMGSIKTDVAKYFIKKFEEENKRFLVFASSIPQAEELGNIKDTIHSKKSAKANAEIIRKFNDEELSKLITIGMLISGMTLTNLSTSIIVQLDSGAVKDSDEVNGIKIIQQCGRNLRGENPEIYILVLKGTKDEEYLKNAITAIGEEFIIKN